MRWAYHIITPGHDNTIGGLSIRTKTAGIFSPGRKLLLSPIWWNIPMSSHVYQANSNATGWSSCNSFTCNSFTCYPVGVTVAAIAQVETLEEAWKHFRILWILLCFLSCFHTWSGPYGPRLFKTATYRGFSAATVPAMVKGSHQQSLKQCLINHQKVKIWIWPHMSSYLVRQVSDHPYNGICIPNKMVSTLFPPCPAFKTSLSRCSRSCARPLSQACSCFNVGCGGWWQGSWLINSCPAWPSYVVYFFPNCFKMHVAVSTLFTQTHYIQLLYYVYFRIISPKCVYKPEISVHSLSHWWRQLGSRMFYVHASAQTWQQFLPA